MKLRAPRCKDSTLLMSVPACGSPSPSSAAAVGGPAIVPSAAAAATTAANSNCLCMSRDPLRLRLHAVELRVPGHQQKERKIKRRADLGEHRIDAGGRLQSADAQHDESHRKYSKGYL